MHRILVGRCSQRIFSCLRKNIFVAEVFFCKLEHTDVLVFLEILYHLPYEGAFVFLAPVVQTLGSAIHLINHYPLDNSIGFASVYPLDSDLSGGQRYPSFEQLGPGHYKFLSSSYTRPSFQHWDLNSHGTLLQVNRQSKEELCRRKFSRSCMKS